jgi:plastocyanin
MRRSLALANLAVVGLILAGCAGASPTPAGTPAVTLPLSAMNLAFDQSTLSVPADQTFAIELDNKDAVPHNVAISGNGQSRNSDPFTGPATRTLVFAALPAGTYTFLCSVHPDMTGTVQVAAGG